MVKSREGEEHFTTFQVFIMGIKGIFVICHMLRKPVHVMNVFYFR